MRYFRKNDGNTFIDEKIMWSFICQLVSALRVIHGAGLACRVINPSKVLVTGKNRFFSLLLQN